MRRVKGGYCACWLVKTDLLAWHPFYPWKKPKTFLFHAWKNFEILKSYLQSKAPNELAMLHKIHYGNEAQNRGSIFTMHPWRKSRGKCLCIATIVSNLRSMIQLWTDHLEERWYFCWRKMVPRHKSNWTMTSPNLLFENMSQLDKCPVQYSTWESCYTHPVVPLE